MNIPLDHKYNACLAPDQPWARRLAFVADEARHVLAKFGTQRVVSTKDLIELLYPESLARGGDAHLARKSIGRLLRTLATGDLADCARRGPMAKVRGKVVHLWEWGAPQTADGLPVYNDDYAAPAPAPVDVGEYIRTALASFERDPASTDYQRGYQAALETVQREALGVRAEGYFVEHNGEQWQSVFPSAEAHLSQLHVTVADAIVYMIDEQGVAANITVLA